MKLDELKNQILNDKPTEEQLDIIFADPHNCVVRACPGSGKTWTAVRRMAWRVATWNYKVGGIALLSFTNAAVKEFSEALTKTGLLELASDSHYIGTIDSFIERFVLSPFGHLVMKCDKRPRLFIGPSKYDWSRSDFQITVDGGRSIKVWDVFAGRVEDKTTFGYKKSRFSVECTDIHRDTCIKQLVKFGQCGHYSHDQRNLWAYALLDKNPAILNILVRRFPELLIDECQDTSSLQQAILKSLIAKGCKITFIGDSDQCIYEFNQAQPSLMKELENSHDFKDYPLSINWRSNQLIVDAVKNFSKYPNIKSKFSPKHTDHGAFICRYEPGKEQSLIKEFAKLPLSLGLNIEKTVVLARNHSTIQKMAGTSYIDEIQGQTRELAEAAYQRDCLNNYRKCYEIVYKSIKRMTVDQLDWDKIEGDDQVQSFEFRQRIWKFIRSDKKLPCIETTATDWIESLKSNLASLFTDLGVSGPRHIGKSINLKGLKNKGTPLVDYYETPNKPIRVTTIHQVKGQTLDAVLFVANSKFINSVMKHRNDDVLPEDVRLGYVAMTRPKHLLIIALPDEHFDKHSDDWKKLGFRIKEL